MKAKIIFLSSALALCLTGCGVKIINTTPETAPASPTGSVTLSAEAKVKQKTVVPDSLEAFVVIHGEHYPMDRVADFPPAFTYDYQAPAEQVLTRFYYVLNYTAQKEDEAPISEQIISELYQVQVPSTLTLRLDRTRAAVGTRATITGQQFSADDRVFVDQVAAETILVSPSTLQFVVPEVKPSFGYKIEVRGTTRSQKAGYLRVDPASPLSVLPKALTLAPGQRKALAFALEHPAPIDGLYINITTDIPDSIIMPEVLIPEGARTVSATIEGGKVSSGHLYIQAKGLPELVVPVTVR